MTATEIGTIMVELEEAEAKLGKIEKMWNLVTDEGLKDAPKFTEDEKKELTRAEKKINFEIKFKSEHDEVHFVTAPDKKVYVASWAEQTRVWIDDNHKYHLDEFMVPFDNAEDVVRMANLTNFLKIHFTNRVSTNVDKPWYKANNGDLKMEDKTFMDTVKGGDWRNMFTNLTVADGEDGFKSALVAIGGSVFESRTEEYAQYLNKLKNTNNESVWVKKSETGMIPEDLKSMESTFNANLKFITS